MDLSEARGLLLFRVIRGGIEITQRLGAVGTGSSTGVCHTHPRTRASQEPTDHHQRRPPGSCERNDHTARSRVASMSPVLALVESNSLNAAIGRAGST